MSRVKVLLIVVARYGAFPAFAQDYESYQLYLGSYPEDANCGWHKDAQGVAHDDNNWFITQTEWIWKIPVERDLWSISASDPDVLTRSIGSYQELAGYAHFGDPDVYRYDNTDYLVMPIEHEDEAQPGAIAVFRCEEDDLSYRGHVELTNQDGESYQGHDAGWCAVNSGGRVFSSMQHPGLGGGPSLLLEYILDWNLLASEPPQATITLEAMHAMRDELDNPLNLITMQGGEFAPGDGLLYLISGFHDDNAQEEVSEGIHVLESAGPFVWRRVAHSTNGSGHFDYYYDAGYDSSCCAFGCCPGNEPEGLTIWDLDDGRAPGIRGQLHAFMLDNDQPDDDDIYFYHYTNIIRVDSASSCQTGTPACPFRTVNGAANLAWNGSEIRIQAGSYDETLTISQRVRFTAEGGMARIGG